jgi:eukaryotic-like serine/threonine-protein kinase
MSTHLPTLAERYVLLDEVGRGGMASVWEAKDEVLARTVAIKLLHGDLADDPAFLERFRAEALAAARLTHPHVIQTFDTGSDEGKPFIVMEFCPGGTLGGLIEKEGFLEPTRSVDFALQICEALSYAHLHRVIHRDVKPGNILIGAMDSLKVGDFGIAKAAFTSKDISTTGAILGTVMYISPEQARGEEPDERSDLYSLGVVLYEMLTGRPPFVGETQIATAMMHVRAEPPPLRSLRAGVPRNVEAAVMRALSKNPNQRFASALEMADELRDAGGRDTTALPRIARVITPAKSPAAETSWMWKVLGAIGALILVALVVVALVQQDGPIQQLTDDLKPGGQAAELKVQDVDDFDPYGGDEEHGEDAPLAADNNESTAWETEGYTSSLSAQGKPGVGLVFDLGETADVSRVEATFPAPGLDYELRVANASGSTEDDFKLVKKRSSAAGNDRFDASGRGRFWLLWITDLPGGGGGKAYVAEVRFFGES